MSHPSTKRSKANVEYLTLINGFPDLPQGYQDKVIYFIKRLKAQEAETERFRKLHVEAYADYSACFDRCQELEALALANHSNAHTMPSAESAAQTVFPPSKDAETLTTGRCFVIGSGMSDDDSDSSMAGDDDPVDCSRFATLDVGTQVSSKILRRKPRSNLPRVMQCYRCQRFGHVAAKCSASPKCRQCGGDHNSRNCDAGKDIPPVCANCLGSHKSSSRSCPALPKVPLAPKAKVQNPVRNKESGTSKVQTSRSRPGGNKFKKPSVPPQDYSSFSSILHDLHSTQVAILEHLRKNDATHSQAGRLVLQDPMCQ